MSSLALDCQLVYTYWHVRSTDWILVCIALRQHGVSGPVGTVDQEFVLVRVVDDGMPAWLYLADSTKTISYLCLCRSLCVLMYWCVCV